MNQSPQNRVQFPAPDRLARRSVLMVGVGLFLVLYTTLFPFDFFVRTEPAALRSFDLTLTRAYVLADFPRNVLLFVPLGFGLAGMRAGNGRSWRTFSLVVGIGLALSALMEVAQAVALLRFPSLADVLANGLGAGAGFWLFCLAGGRFWGGVDWLEERIRPFLAPRRFLPLYLLYLTGWLVLSAWLPSLTRLDNWDNQFPLIVGNEQTRDRPWQGVLRQFYIADRAFSAEEVGRIFAGEGITTVGGKSVVAQYDFTNPLADNFPPVRNEGSRAAPLMADRVALSGEHWLASDGAVTAVSDALAASSQFTLVLEGASGDLQQSGPARLISISGDPYRRNLTLGQEGPDLVVRLRMPLTGENGRQPELIIPNVFTDTQMHRIVMTYDGTTVRLAIDRAQNVYTVELLPAVALFVKTFPNEVDQMRLNRGNMAIFHLLYSLGLFLPWAAWVAYRRLSGLWLLLGLSLPPLIWDVLLSWLLPGYVFQVGHVVISMGGTAVAFLIARQYHRFRFPQISP